MCFSIMRCGSEVEQKATVQEVLSSKPTVVLSFFLPIMSPHANFKENLLKF
jgi:hypothetical protein